MNRAPAISIIVLAGAAAGAAFWASSWRGVDPAGTAATANPGTPFFPQLVAKGDSAARIVVARAEGSFTVRLDSGVWRVVENANYPARLETVRSVLVGLSQLRGAEVKTSRPENFGKLGLEDPVTPVAGPAAGPGGASIPRSTLVTVSTADGVVLASAIVGDTRWGTPPGTYLRRVGESQAYLVAGRVEVPHKATQWLQATIAGVDKERVRSVDVTRSSGEPLSVSRGRPGESFTLAGVPTGRELRDPSFADQLAGLLSSTTLQDVRPAEEVDFTAGDGPEARIVTTARVRTFDGLVVAVEAMPKDGRTWWRLSASVDESVEGLRPADAPADALPTTALEAIRKQASDLDARWAGYAYAPAEAKGRLLNLRLTDLLKDVPLRGGAGPG